VAFAAIRSKAKISPTGIKNSPIKKKIYVLFAYSSG